MQNYYDMIKITIGMTAYNSEKYIEASIKSLLAQSVKEFKLIISDDASSDSTEMVCRKLMSLDSRIYYIRQEKNLGPKANFESVFRLCETEYFMWASHDDIWSRTFIEKCISELDANPDAGFVITKWIVESRKIPFLRRAFLPNMAFVADPDSITRMMSYTSLPFLSFKDNMTYGIWRQQALSRIISDTRKLKYFSIGGAANEYTLLLYRGCYAPNAYLRKRYIYAPPGSFIAPFIDFLYTLIWWKDEGHKKVPTYFDQDYLDDLETVFNIAGLDNQTIAHAIKLNMLHMKL